MDSTQPSPIAALTQQLHQQLTSPAGTSASRRWLRELDEIVQSNELSDPARVPPWFLNLWTALAEGRCVATTGFAMNQIVPVGRRGEFGDVVNFLAELADILPIGHDNYGEGIRLELHGIGLQAFISMEAAGGGCSYEVTALVV